MEELESKHDETIALENKETSTGTNNSESMQSFQPPVSEELERTHISKRGNSIWKLMISVKKKEMYKVLKIVDILQT